MYDLSNGSVTSFQGHGVIFRPIDALNVLCAQLTHELFAIAKFLYYFVIIKSQLAIARLRLHASMMSICLSVCLSVCLSPKCKKTRFSKKRSNLVLWCLLTTYRKSHMGFSKNPLLDLYNPRWLRYATLKIDMTSFFSA